MIKSKYLTLGVLAIAIVGIILISGCTQQQPSQQNDTQSEIETPITSVDTFNLKELHADILKPDNTQGSIFVFTYSTNQDHVKMELTGPDGSVNGFSLDKGEDKSAWGSIPPKGEYVKVPGTYKITVNTSAWPPETIFEKEFTYSGADLHIENITTASWKHFYSCPVHEFWPNLAVTVSNKGDLPAYAKMRGWIDDKLMTFGSYGLGYVEAGETKTFTDLSFDTFVTEPGEHTISAELISYLPGGDTNEYYHSSKVPYTLVPVSDKNDYEYLQLDTYSTTIHTSLNTPEIQKLVDNCCSVAGYCK